MAKMPKKPVESLLTVAKANLVANIDGAVYASTLAVLERLHKRAARKPEVKAFLEKAIAEVKQGGGQDGGGGPSQGPPDVTTRGGD
ncbi:MAG: hypothetical protein FJW32_10945 [Acidobacteria bacterium]|nr:hypothetical protein [Acidobacteriota bacterium]